VVRIGVVLESIAGRYDSGKRNGMGGVVVEELWAIKWGKISSMAAT